MTRNLTTTAALLTLTLPLTLASTACGTTETDALISVLPDDRVMVSLPTDGVSQTARGDLGVWSEAYIQTANATQTVNGMISNILGLVDHLTQLRPSSYDRRAQVAVWGPYSDTLDPAETTLTVQHDSVTDTYTWWFTQWPKGDDSAAITVVAGEVDAGATRDVSTGRFIVDFTALASLDPTVDNTGTFTSEYDIALDGNAASASFADWADVGGTDDPIDAYYVYDEGADGSGSMDLAWQDDYLDDGVMDVYVLRSRWDATGAGRGDEVLAEGGDDLLGAASQCWDTGFKLVYEETSWEGSTGDASQCVFDTPAWPE